VSDIANAIYDGTDAVMLSEESTLGEYPEEAVTMLTRVAKANEMSEIIDYGPIAIADSISKSVYKTANNVRAKYIIALTESGKSACLVARFNPNIPILALTPRPETVKRLTLSSNIQPYLIDGVDTIEKALSFIPEFLTTKKLAKKGDVVVVTAGIPFGVKGSTNMLFVITV
jgi:pyruvate kinase